MSAPPQANSDRTFSLATTCCIVSTVLPVFSRRNAISCDCRRVACSTVGVKETPQEFHRLKVHTSQDMRRSTRNAATLKCLFFPIHLFTMLTLLPNAWASGTSQVMSDQHSRFQMMVPIPKLRRIPAQGISCWFRRPRSAPDCNQQTPLRKCTSGTSPSKHLALSASKANLRTLPPSQSMRLRDP